MRTDYSENGRETGKGFVDSSFQVGSRGLSKSLKLLEVFKTSNSWTHQSSVLVESSILWKSVDSRVRTIQNKRDNSSNEREYIKMREGKWRDRTQKVTRHIFIASVKIMES